MKKLALLSTLAVAAFSAAMLTHAQASAKKVQPLATPRAVADEASACSNQTLEGNYGVSVSGTRPAPPPPGGIPNYVPGTIEQVVGVGIQTFDGDGNFTQITNEKGSLSGILVPNRAGQGTYTVNADCSGTITLHIPGLPFAVAYDTVIVNHGKELHSFVVSPQAVMVSSTARKVD